LFFAVGRPGSDFL